MHAYNNKTYDVSKDSSQIQTLKCFVAQTVAPIEKLFSHKKFSSTRSSKLDPMLICSGDPFFRIKNYHASPT